MNASLERKSTGLSKLEVVIVFAFVLVLTYVASFVIYPRMQAKNMASIAEINASSVWGLLEKGMTVEEGHQILQSPINRRSFSWSVAGDVAKGTQRIDLTPVVNTQVVCEKVVGRLLEEFLPKAPTAALEVNGQRVTSASPVVPCNPEGNRLSVVASSAPQSKPAAGVATDAVAPKGAEAASDLYSSPSSGS